MSDTECVHVQELRAHLRSAGLSVRGEFTDGSWVNVHCRQCGRTWEVNLHDDLPEGADRN